MGIVLDTSILIAAERRALRFEALLESLGDEPVAIGAITASELLHGCHRATNAGVRARRSAFVEALLDAIPVLPFGLGEARLHAEIWAELARQGTVIGPHDLLIAASAMARGYSVASMNQDEFARVAGLQTVAIDRFLS
jgi:tRNA(fMet)-specific endonuclease VapC